MKRELCVLLLFSAACLGACSNGAKCSTEPVKPSSSSSTPSSASSDWGDPVYDGNPIKVSSLVSENGLTYLEVDGHPFPLLGGQIRTDAYLNCDKYKIEELETFFEEAEELGLTVIQVPVQWKDIEPKEGEFDFSFADAMLSFANKHGLKMEFLWFGSNMCGDTHSYSTPDYILKDGKSYPKLSAKRTGEFWNYYGIQWYLDYDNPNLLAKEGNAIKALLDHVYDYDSTHEGKKPLIGLQVTNEPDVFPRWRLDQWDVIDPETGEKMSQEVAWRKIRAQLNSLGGAAKSSKYQIYTRVNFAGLSSDGGIYSGSEVKEAPDWAKQIAALENIDAIGDDPYKSLIDDIQGISNMLGEKLPGNLSLISENAGDYANTPSLILTAAGNNAGYDIYDLATSPFYIANSTSATIDQGIASVQGKGWTKKEHFGATAKLLRLLRLAGGKMVRTPAKNIACFNLKGNDPETGLDQSIDTENASVRMTSASAPLAYCVDDGSSLFLASTEEAKVEISNVTPVTLEEGRFSDDESWNPAASLPSSSSFTLEAGKGYRLTYTGRVNELKSTAWEAIGA